MPQYRNAMEIVVEETYDAIKNSLNCCQCEICRADVIACALNRLPPKYVASPQGVLYSKAAMLEGQHRIMILSALAEAAKIVQSKPKHA